MQNNEQGMAQALVVGAIALAVGIGGGYAIAGANKDEQVNNQQVASTTVTADTKAADLRVALNSLEAQHVDLAAAATRAGFNGDPSFDAAAGALNENTNQLTAAIESVYGEEAGKKFNEIWSSHIGFFVDYTVAAKAGDTAGMEKAVENLNGYVAAISDLLGGATGLPKDAVASLVTEHVMLLKKAVDEHGAGNYEASYAAQQEARDQITNQIADTLSGAIIKQNSDKFAN